MQCNVALALVQLDSIKDSNSRLNKGFSGTSLKVLELETFVCKFKT